METILHMLWIPDSCPFKANALLATRGSLVTIKVMQEEERGINRILPKEDRRSNQVRGQWRGANHWPATTGNSAVLNAKAKEDRSRRKTA